MRKNKSYFTLIFLFFCGSLLAQNQINSPYSRFGIGDLQSNILSEYAAMGGSSIGSYNPNIVNPYNPASYSAFRVNSFIFSTGGAHQTTKMQTINLEQTTNNSSFSHLILGFPISKMIGVSAGYCLLAISVIILKILKFIKIWVISIILIMEMGG